ncbi:MFS transporter [Siminovitchia thermophila]
MAAAISMIVALLPAGTSYIVMVPVAFLFGFGVSGFNGIWMNATTELVPEEQLGIATGFSITVGSWGVVAGPPFFGFIVDMSGSFISGWLFISFMMGIVVMLLLNVMSVKQEESKKIKHFS